MTPAELGAQWRPIETVECENCGWAGDSEALVRSGDNRHCPACEMSEWSGIRTHLPTTPAPATGPDARDGEG